MAQEKVYCENKTRMSSSPAPVIDPKRVVVLKSNRPVAAGPPLPPKRVWKPKDRKRLDFWPFYKNELLPALLKHVIAREALLTAFSAIATLRASEPVDMLKFALMAPIGTDREAFAEELLGILTGFLEPHGIRAEIQTSKTTERCYVSICILLAQRKIMVATVSDCPVFEDFVDLSLDAMTWRLAVKVAGKSDWMPRQLIPVLLHRSLETGGNYGMVTSLEEALSYREHAKLPMPYEKSEYIYSLMTPETDQTAEAEAEDPAFSSIVALFPPASVATGAWENINLLCDWLIDQTAVPCIPAHFAMELFASEMEANGLSYLHQSAKMLKLRNPTASALSLYHAASITNPIVRHGFWILMRLPLLLVFNEFPHPILSEDPRALWMSGAYPLTQPAQATRP